MIKSKRMTGVLLVTAALVWGIILYRVVSAVHTEVPCTVTERQQVSANVPPDDTLLLDYADPFLKGLAVPRINKERTRPVYHPQAVQPQPPAFRYKGKIRKRNTDYLMVEKDGIQQLVSCKEKFGGYQFVRVSPDSIVVRKNKQCYTLFVE